jgi:hypothetical protein
MSNNYFSQANGQAAVAQVTIREADASDAPALRRLAELDSGRVPAQPMLIAEVGGSIRAAVSMSSGDVIADPFHPTQEVVEMMKIHKQTSNATGLFGHSRQRPAPSAPGIPGFPVVPTAH